METLKV